MQSKAKPFDDLTNLVTNAVGAMKGVGDEVKAMGRARAEEMIADLDLVGRDEFAILKEIVEAQRLEIEALKRHLAEIAPAKTPRKAAPKKPSAKKTSPKMPAAKKASAKKVGVKTKAAAKKKPLVKKPGAKKTVAKKPAAKKKT